MFDGEHVASRINVPLFSPSSDTQTLSPVCSGVAPAFPRNSSFARVRKLTLSLFRNATSDVASKGHLCEYCCMPRKYCRYGFSAISFTSARSDSFLRYWIMRAPSAILRGFAGCPLWEGNRLAYTFSSAPQSIRVERTTHSFFSSSCIPQL